MRRSIVEVERLIPDLTVEYEKNKSLTSVVAHSNDVKVWIIDQEMFSLLPIYFQNLII